MTSELKTLMDQAADRPTTFTPDVADLVAAGRHRTRARRVLLSAATAATAATAVIAVLLVGHLGSPRTAPQPATTVSQPTAVTDLCAKSDDFFRTANDDAWRRQVVSNWTDKVVEVSDADGAMTVRRSPDGSQYAYCVSGVPLWGEPLGGFGATLLNRGIVTRAYQIQRYWSIGCGDEPIDRSSPQGRCNIGGARYSYAGRVPQGVTRIAFSGLGQHTDATIKDGYWVHRVFTDDIRKGNDDPIYITMYDVAGKQVFREEY